jgi:TonB-like protein
MISSVGLALALIWVAPDVTTGPPLIAGRDVPPPRKTKHVAAPFPAIARTAFPPVEGIILLRLTLNEEGRPVDILVLTRIPLLDLAAIEAAKQWEYEPTSVEGVPRRVTLKALVEFFLSPRSRERYLTDVAASGTEDVGLRLYAIQSLISDPLDRKAIQKALERAARDKNEAVASAARTGLATIAHEERAPN